MPLFKDCLCFFKPDCYVAGVSLLKAPYKSIELDLLLFGHYRIDTIFRGLKMAVYCLEILFKIGKVTFRNIC
ncbi:MAG: hypothetical protein COB81_11155 [Flavobacteriaceae bacterium]|nr:MAG: hypothetical protein COB81_11155 [Flavobacteriaceae bacterium]